ncbi:MFS transporter [Pseudonocardia oroxyli]|uniref:Drug resistance transporter, EmrB/QacA subfamily n=1 Tax=Pseudonocardia oroxyli TaxID=366584 RepID=A0A1G8E3H5_PSEOR|nr:MFS transporter [Pseudonocardia oroxyli]SDH64199.1 drug resistance transporter, EmrB/QacA subfamily [Pseudonocardia oroxyli]
MSAVSAGVDRGARRATTAVALISGFMVNLDLWVVNVAITAIGGSLSGSSLAGLSWVINGYAIALAALLIVSGRAADRYGARRVVQAGMVVFTLASVLCALSPNLAALVAFRVVQGVGAAMLTTASLSLLLGVTPVEGRAHAVRNWAAVGALAAATGPTLGGLLVALDWRWIFLINLPIGVAAFLLGALRVPRTAGRPDAPHPDLLGALLLSATVAALVAVVIEAPADGFTPTVLVSAAVLVVAGVGFVVRSRVHANPLIAPAMLRLRGFPLVNVAMLVFAAAFGIMLLANSLWMQDVWHFSAVQTGLAMAPGPLMVPLTTAVLRRYGRGVRPIVFVVFGGILFALGMAWAVVARTPEPAYLTAVLPQLVATGVGVGLTMGNLLAAGSALVPHEHTGASSGVLNTSRQVGSSVGVAVIVTALAATGQSVRGFDIGWVVAVACALLVAVIAALLARRDEPAGVSG